MKLRYTKGRPNGKLEVASNLALPQIPDFDESVIATRSQVEPFHLMTLTSESCADTMVVTQAFRGALRTSQIRMDPSMEHDASNYNRKTIHYKWHSTTRQSRI